jgi:thioredoxin 2
MSPAKAILRCHSCGARNRVPVASAGKPRCAKCKTDLRWVANVDDATFDDIVKESPVPVVADFWAPWCGPCKMIAPALEELADERAGALRIVKVNVDENPGLSGRFRTQSIPTLVLLEDGKETSRQIGALPKHAIGSWIDQATK